MTMPPPIRITLGMLHDTIANFPPQAKATKVNRSFYLATSILKHFFGEGWLFRYLGNPGYLHIIEADQNTTDLSGLRIIDLAEVIYNLQDVPNFDTCITRMRGGDIEGTAAELDLGRMLYLNKVPFRYVVPQGVKGKDYDADILFSGGVVACADAKCALENSDLKAKAISNKLEKARRQLPADQPGIIFVKTPAHWMADTTFLSIVIEQTSAFFAKTERIVSVKYYVAPRTIEGGYVKQEHAYKEMSNPKTRFARRDWTLFRPFNLPPEANGMPSHWQRILFFPDGIAEPAAA
jgi:hypothetical protein